MNVDNRSAIQLKKVFLEEFGEAYGNFHLNFYKELIKNEIKNNEKVSNASGVIYLDRDQLYTAYEILVFGDTKKTSNRGLSNDEE